jgi:phosphatidylserine/phosphatidylglycerophosphate/cardiolipin synthase-like enzyme
MGAVDLAAWFLTPPERENAHTRIDAAHPPGAAWTTGNRVRPIVHGRPYFAELHERISRMGPGDRICFADWRGDPGEQLTDDADSTVAATLAAAARRGVDVRGLLWRSHWRRLGFHAEQSRFMGEEIGAAGGQCLRDMRVRTLGAHHQKLVVLRHRDDPGLDVAYVGGIDLCRSRRDDAAHHGDRQALPMAAAYGPTPAWHDVQVAVQGPAVHDVETTFRERWQDSTPLTLNPGRSLTSFLQGEDQTPEPLGAQAPPPPPVPGGHCAVQVVRTYPAIQPKGYDFAPDGELSIALSNTKAIAHARRLVYVEDQYFWSEQVGRHFATVLRANPALRLAVVLPTTPDRDGALTRTPMLHARRLALEPVLAAGGDRVAVFGLSNDEGLPVYVHSKVCIIDDLWASVGSDNLNRRSWTSDSEIACLVMDERADEGGTAPTDAFPPTLRSTLVAEHLGCAPDQVPDDPVELFDMMVAAADALDTWFGSAPVRPHRLSSAADRIAAQARRRSGRRAARARTRALGAADTLVLRSTEQAARPPGRLRRLDLPRLSWVQRRWADRLYQLYDPDGTVLRDEDLGDLTTPGVVPQR